MVLYRYERVSCLLLPRTAERKGGNFLTAHTKPIISALTEIELFSAVSKKVRKKEMKRKDAGRVVARFLADIENGYYTYLPLEASHYRLARDWIGMFILPIGTLDALHLAISSSEDSISSQQIQGCLSPPKPFHWMLFSLNNACYLTATLQHFLSNPES